MGDIAAASIQNATTNVQQTAQIAMLKKATDAGKDMAARLLAGVQPAASASTNLPGIGQMVDRRA